MTLAIDGRITLEGAPGSPYTRKMLALLRYRQIPYRFLFAGDSARLGWAQPKVRLLPTFYFPNEQGDPQPVTDSTPIIRTLEREYPARQVVPDNPVVALIDRLLEDYGDEWLTKPMFHYRWVYEADIKRSAQTLPHWRAPAQPDSKLAELGEQFASRQIGRLGVVGSNEITGPVIEASYLRFVQLLHTHLQSYRFIFGSRPSCSDFALFGQLTCLAQFDPTPMAATFETGGRIYAWVSMMEDQSGLNTDGTDWAGLDQLPGTVHAMLAEMGRTYVPVMLANERAISDGQETVQTTVDGKPWQQRPFPYQAKCVRWIREARAQLTDAHRVQFDQWIAGTGVEALFNVSDSV